MPSRSHSVDVVNTEEVEDEASEDVVRKGSMYAVSTALFIVLDSSFVRTALGMSWRTAPGCAWRFACVGRL